MPVHPSSVVSPESEVHPTAEIGPFCLIEAGVRVGAGCRLISHVVLRSGSVLGDEVVVHSHAVIGDEPQDLRFDPSLRTGVEIGARTVVREHATVHRATKPGTVTHVGEGCLLMASSHIGHDCVVGNRVILVNAALVAGHVEVGDDAMLGGGCAVHQGTRIGQGSMLGGASATSQDLPPFCLAAGRNRLSGLNLVGLRRRGFSRDEISDVKRCFADVYAAIEDPRRRAISLLVEGFAATDKGRIFLEWFKTGARPVMRPAIRGGSGGDEA
jgi:UDP-N-acetylglucosamine acyltransferase